MVTINAGRPGLRRSEAIHLQTPVDRDRALDGYRALAITGVVLGHWLVGALVLVPDGALAITSPLVTLRSLAPASWLLQMLGLFFLVGGYAASASLDRSSARGEPYARWLQRRFVRLGRPVVAGIAASAVGIGLLAALGVPTGTLRVWVILFLQPLWFVLVYGVATLLTRFVDALDRRLGAWAALPLAAVVATGDLLRYGPWHDLVPSWVGLVNVLPGWLFGYQLGVAWARGRLDRAGWPLLLVGGTTFAVLLLDLGYPASMVGVPGADRSNASPPSLLVVALAATQAGLAIINRERVGRWMRRPGVWAPVAMINLTAMTIFCWHQVPLVLLSAGGAALDGVPGLNDAPTSAGWVVDRVPWLVVMTALLVLLVAAASRFERPWTTTATWVRPAVGVLVAAFAGVALVLY